MAADYKVTELFCVIDEFYKYFGAENAGHCTGCKLNCVSKVNIFFFDDTV